MVWGYNVALYSHLIAGLQVSKESMRSIPGSYLLAEFS
jgi:hypothetical protein